MPKLALEIQDLSLPATVLLPRLDNSKKHPSTAAHVPGAQGEMRMQSTKKSMSQNKPAEIDEFIFMQPNGIIIRNTWISIIEYRIRGNQIGAI